MTNILPYDGEAFYIGPVIPLQERQFFYDALAKEVEWVADEVVMFGKKITMSRLSAWYGDSPFAYAYSHTTRKAKSWTPTLLSMKARIEEQSNTQFNSCLLNLYHHGAEGMGWHSDDESTIVEESSIASVSLGAERKFSFRHKGTKETTSLILENGSLLVMKGKCQQMWHHCLPKSKRVVAPRINLTLSLIHI